LESTSPTELAREILRSCLDGAPAPAGALDALIAEAIHADPARAREGSRALFAELVEPLADRFEPALCDRYAELFSQAIERVIPDLRAAGLVERYRRIRGARPAAVEPKRVFVLSRVTLGADVAVTSVALDAVKRRFPRARIVFAGTRKAWELFETDPRLEWLPVDYGRGATLAGRLAAWEALRHELDDPGSIVVDPDSRLTQLGLLPVCAEQRYFFFESRAYGGDGNQTLSALARRWARETFGVEEAHPWIAPREAPGKEGEITLSLGVGENLAKRVPDPFEEELVRGLLALGATLLIDRGAGGEERERVDRAIARSGARSGQIETWEGAFAPFAARIARSRLYVGYDSAGQHVAAACGVPLVSVFGGFVCERMFARWRPGGPAPVEVIRVGENPPSDLLAETLSAAGRLSAGPIVRRSL
jgi:ADP-heptose:LPS heptosyltransferase